MWHIKCLKFQGLMHCLKFIPRF